MLGYSKSPLTRWSGSLFVVVSASVFTEPVPVAAAVSVPLAFVLDGTEPEAS